jgi:hypothetical protein
LPDNTIKESVKAKVLANSEYNIADYAEIIKAAYERSSYMGKDPISIEDKTEVLEIKGRKVDVINVTMPFPAEKK